MKFRLRTKLSAAILIASFIVFAMVSILANFLLERQFREYVISKQEQRNKDIAALIAERFADWGGRWDPSGIENIGVSLLEEGIILKITDSAGKGVWDATVHNNGLCSEMLSHMANNMQGYYPRFEGGYAEKQYPVFSGLSEVGAVKIGYYGPFYFSDNDVQFLVTLNRLLIAAAAVSLLISLFLGAFMAKRISDPISNVIGTAMKIAAGDFSERAPEKSNTKEIIKLTETINHLAETLGRQEGLRKRLTSDVAHELRTPVAILQSHLEAMIDGVWSPDKERLKSCHEEILRIKKMTGDIEKLARFESENLKLDISSFDVTELLRGLITGFEAEAGNRKIEIRMEGSGQFMDADMDKVSRILLNLISNALKFTPEGGKVSIAADGDEETVRVVVRDTGIGISEEDLPHIFERFYRADKSRSRLTGGSGIELTGGSGIGLAIAKSLAAAHNGSIAVKSQLNRGSEFTLILPRKQKG